jgi:hypothetical protein
MRSLYAGLAAVAFAAVLLTPAASARRTPHHAASCPPGVSDADYCQGPPSIDGSPQTCLNPTHAYVDVSTSVAGDLIVAFVRSDSPASDGNTSVVTGGGLSWHRVAQENKALGDAEVWVATAPARLHDVAITATATKYQGYDEALTVIAFENASGIGASGTFYSQDGAPTGTIRTTAADSWVFAAGDDWLASKARTAGPNQTIEEEDYDKVGDTYWVQSTKAPTAAAGTPVTINDTAPAHDPYNLVLVEIV